jgi:hypothetical protein
MSELVDAVKKLIKLSEENIENIRVLTAENERLKFELAVARMIVTPGEPQPSSADPCTYVARNRGGCLPNEIYCKTHGWDCPKLNDPAGLERFDAPETP